MLRNRTSGFPSLLMIGLLFTFFAVKVESRRVIEWNNLQDFIEGGWWPANPELLPGAAFDKPSDISEALRPLDDGVTGNGVWSGRSLGDRIHFKLNGTSFDDSIIEASLTFKYYCVRRTSGIVLTFYGCQRPSDPAGYCALWSNPTLEWATVNYPINMTFALTEGLTFSTYTGAATCLFDSVELSTNGGEK